MSYKSKRTLSYILFLAPLVALCFVNITAHVPSSLILKIISILIFIGIYFLFFINIYGRYDCFAAGMGSELELAARNNNVKYLKKLVKNFNVKEKQKALNEAISFFNSESAEILIKNGAILKPKRSITI